MDDDPVQDESTDESSGLPSQSPYLSDDSRHAETYADHDNAIDFGSSDKWENYSYYDTFEHCQDPSQESLPPTVANARHKMFVRTVANGPTLTYTSVDAFEENNNDPNNNMDSIEIASLEDSGATAAQSSAAAPRLVSPRPGCSKDSLPLVTGDEIFLDDETIRERVKQVLGLVSSINRHSVYAAITRNPQTAVGDLKLTDLAGKEEGSEYPESSIAGNASRAEASTVKRGPAEDICTTGYKKSSNSEAAMLVPVLLTKLTSSKTTSEIPVPMTGYISKIVKPRRIDLPNRVHPKIVISTHTDAAKPVAELPKGPVARATGAVFIDNSKGAIPKDRSVSHDERRLKKDRVKVGENASPMDTTQNLADFAPPMDTPRTYEATLPHEETVERNVCMEMYYKLRTIFPNVEANYLKRLCPPEWGPGDRDAQFTPIVEYLLENENNLPLGPAQSHRDNEEAANGPGLAYGNVDDVYENLLGIFPDADPHYLREFAERNLSKPDAIKEFVESKLELRDYPTREQYKARLKITEQQRQYTTGFNVKQYLTIIPDPFKHFLDPKRKCKHSTVALEFLKSHFNKIRVTTISPAYIKFAYNLSITAEALERIGPEMKSRRACIEIPTEDILLLQEIAFVKHKAAISEHIASVKRAEEAEFKIMKEQNFLVECQCCYDSECVPSKCSSCENGHLFCNNCIVAGTNTKLGDSETRISCFVNCGSEISLSVLQRVLAPTTFSILLKKRQAAEVMEAGLEGLVSCPFCNFASIPPEEDKIFKCLNPECTKESCRLCKELSHVPLRCDEVLKADKARHYIEETMTAALARKCYKCQRAFFKEEGCNKINCPCGAIMCYLCDQPIRNYTHFSGQGSSDQTRCPLYSDTIRLDAVAVRRVGEVAQMEVMKRNPNIKIDTANLLPAIPQATQGPHRNVPNADELPRRAQRVFNLHQL